VTGAQAAGGQQQQRAVFAVDEDAALSELVLKWAPAGYHSFSADHGTYSAVSTDETVLTGGTPDELNRNIQAHWQSAQ
jgi:hypothetical protein